MAVAVGAAACQPTPEELIVQNKADDELEEAIAQTATPSPSASSEDNAPAQSPQSNEPIAYIEDISSNASNTVTVEINAEVINNQPEKIPVVKIDSKLFTEDEVKKMVQTFFGNTQLYERTLTKEDYDEWILNKQLELNDEEKLKVYAADRNIEDLSEARNQLQETIDRLKRERGNASDNRAFVDYSELNSEHGFNLFIDTGKGFLGNVIASEDSVLLSAFNDNNRYYRQRFLNSLRFIEFDNTDTQYQNAKQMAVDFISELGINSVLGDSYLSKDSEEGSTRQFYVFCFEMKLNDTSLDHTLLDGTLAYDNEYNVFCPYTRIEVWIENDQFVQFRYYMPIETSQVLNDNVAINIDYNQAIDLAKQHAYVKHVDTYGNYTEAKLNITKIELIMARTRESENGDFIVVPAWIFRGTLSQKYKPEFIETQGADEQGWYTQIERDDILITVNALDGTIIDMAHGY